MGGVEAGISRYDRGLGHGRDGDECAQRFIKLYTFQVRGVMESALSC